MTGITEILNQYLLTAPVPSQRKLRYRVNCWLRHASGALPITAETVVAFRASALEAGLSNTTVESTLNDIVTILRGTRQTVPELGKRLKRPLPTADQPSLADVGKVYALADRASWPARMMATERGRWWRGYLFLSIWTGLRIEDIRELQWDQVFSDRIEHTASKTGIRHVFPITLETRRHLDMLRGLSGSAVVPVAHGSLRFVREELTDLCAAARIARFGPQMLRRASITEWSCTGADAGALIHGCGLGIRRFYVNPLTVLARAAESFSLPAEMRDPQMRAATDAAIRRLVATASRMNSAESINRLARMAEAW